MPARCGREQTISLKSFMEEKSGVREREIVDRVQTLAEQKGVPPGAGCPCMASAQAGNRVAPIVGASKLHHIEDAVAAFSVALTPEEIARSKSRMFPTPSRDIDRAGREPFNLPALCQASNNSVSWIASHSTIRPRALGGVEPFNARISQTFLGCSGGGLHVSILTQSGRRIQTTPVYSNWYASTSTLTRTSSGNVSFSRTRRDPCSAG